MNNNIVKKNNILGTNVRFQICILPRSIQTVFFCTRKFASKKYTSEPGKEYKSQEQHKKQHVLLFRSMYFVMSWKVAFSAKDLPTYFASPIYFFFLLYNKLVSIYKTSPRLIIIRVAQKRSTHLLFTLSFTSRRPDSRHDLKFDI